jgi:hypothetical protein
MREETGTVLRCKQSRGARPEPLVDVLLDSKSGTGVTVPVRLAHPKAPLPPEPPDPMSLYTVTGYKAVQPGAFHASIRLAGDKILDVSNPGRGGPDFYSSPTGAREAIGAFHKAAQDWFRHYGFDGPADGSDWLEWFVYARPVGVTAARFVGDFKAAAAKLSRP